MNDPKCARMMLGAARRDLRTLRILAEDGPEESFGFHVQQAAEKAIKAWIAVLGETYALTHSIPSLLDQIEKRGANATAIERFRGLAEFTPYAVEFRYQGVDSWTEPIDREAAVLLVRDLVGHVEAELAAAARREKRARKSSDRSSDN